MPPRLSQSQQDIAKELLHNNTPHIVIANTVKCGMSKVKKMSSNLLKYGTLYMPKAKRNGRPRLITPAAVQVSIH